MSLTAKYASDEEETTLHGSPCVVVYIKMIIENSMNAVPYQFYALPASADQPTKLST